MSDPSTVLLPAPMGTPRSPAPTALSAAAWRAAEAGDTPTVLRLLEEEGYADVDARSVYQARLQGRGMGLLPACAACLHAVLLLLPEPCCCRRHLLVLQRRPTVRPPAPSNAHRARCFTAPPRAGTLAWRPRCWRAAPTLTLSTMVACGARRCTGRAGRATWRWWSCWCRRGATPRRVCFYSQPFGARLLAAACAWRPRSAPCTAGR